MTDFELNFEWDDSVRSRARELQATWARLEICAGGEAVTKVESKRTGDTRRAIYVPLYPIAEWAVSNWWFLWEEWQTDGTDSRHNLRGAREGFALPNLAPLPTETKMKLEWQPGGNESWADIAFLSSGVKIVEKAQVKAAFQRLVEAVIGRLQKREIADERLEGDWQAILESETDPEQAAFCEKAARLGYDPFQTDEAAAATIERANELLPDSLADDFFDAVPFRELEQGAKTVKQFVEDAGSSGGASIRPEVLQKLRIREVATPWDQGYEGASALRSFLGLGDKIESNIVEILQSKLGSFDVRTFDAPGRVEGISTTAAGTLILGRPDKRRRERERFTLCRALGDQLFGSGPALVTRAQSERQKRNRAFAAEFLAPSQAIRKRIPGSSLDAEDIADLAQEFMVSEYVIRHQLENQLQMQL